MKSQGIQGPPYKFLHGNFKEIEEMKKEYSINDAMDHLSHDIFPRILPHIFSWKKLYVHHDRKIWGEDVHVFKPDRFAEGVVKATNNNPVAFLPFGYGPRTCLGLNFAMIEAKITLSMILQRYMFTISPTYVHSPVQFYMLRPQHGVKIILHKI
ncbi:hypothetical protein H5410_025099 [Solanum commersonii]|uniref:Cytochrome P450 n=1 Tax=Solanum commersonii TaxID=4109 RepID=A0A9J5YUZ4_SOLCO|nr:hypothetical protein H5410_025099 [Solanum commersonii]